MSPKPKFELPKKDFEIGLQTLDKELGKDEFITAFAPIKVISSGGYLAISILKNRAATENLDYLLDPEWASDDDIKIPLRNAIVQVSHDLDYHEAWMNEDTGVFVTSQARKILFEKAQQQNMVLFAGENIIIFAAPLDWALERKMRRIYTGYRSRKEAADLSDCIAMLKYLRDREKKLLSREYIRTLNVNTFDVIPDRDTMDRIDQAYCEKYGEEIFSK